MLIIPSNEARELAWHVGSFTHWGPWCSKCGDEITEPVEYCGKCGEKTELPHCPNGHSLPISDEYDSIFWHENYCVVCGAKLPDFEEWRKSISEPFTPRTS